MKKIFFILSILIAVSLNAQTNLVNTISIDTRADLYTVANTYDSTFARYVIIELNDSVDIGQVEINYINVQNNEQLFAGNFSYSALEAFMNTAVSNSLSRNAKTLYFFMGYLPHSDRYRITVKLKDLNGNYNGQYIKEF